MNLPAFKGLFFSRPLHLFCRFFLGGLFIYAGIIKIIDPAGMSAAIDSYGLVPRFFHYPLALTLPWVELVAGVFLVAGLRTRSSALMLSLLLSVFMLAIIVNILRGHDHACGCFSSSTAIVNGGWLLIRDFLFLLPGLVLIFFNQRR